MAWVLVVITFSAALTQPSIRLVDYPDQPSCEQAAADVAALHQTATRTVSAYCAAPERAL